MKALHFGTAALFDMKKSFRQVLCGVQTLIYVSFFDFDWESFLLLLHATVNAHTYVPQHNTSNEMDEIINSPAWLTA